MKAIVAVDSNWAIGYENNLLVSIEDDLKRFKELTTDNIVIMGRETFKSIGKPLPNRLNIVLSSNMNDYKDNDTICVKNIECLFELISCFKDISIYVIGGESIYKQLLPYCSSVLVTKIHNEYKADRYFPNLDKNIDFELLSNKNNLMYDKKNHVSYEYLTYKNLNVKN